MRRASCAVVGAIAVLACGSGWVEFESAEGRFSVELPDEPVVTTGASETAAGPVPLHTHTATGPQGTFIVAWSDPPAEKLGQDRDAIFDATREALETTFRGEDVKEERIQLDGHPGRAVTMRVGGAETVIEVRYYLAGQRLYQLASVNSEGQMDTPAARRFFESFEIVGP